MRGFGRVTRLIVGSLVATLAFAGCSADRIGLNVEGPFTWGESAAD